MATQLPQPPAPRAPRDIPEQAPRTVEIERDPKRDSSDTSPRQGRIRDWAAI
jgi:hypothetical protein